MRIETHKTIEGETVEVLVPETPQDIEELKRREEVDDRLSLGDPS